MKEIEVKAKIENKEICLENFRKLGEFSVAQIQTDTIYSKIVGDVDKYLSNDHFLRIRETSEGKVFFTVKKSLKQALSKIEYETAIENKEEMHQAILLMGYCVAVKVKKTRQFLHYKDYEICVDDVEGLGFFVEVEKFSEDDPVIVRKELFDFLISFGISKTDEINVGYDILMLDKK
jgi:adenylate cyclase class 2